MLQKNTEAKNVIGLNILVQSSVLSCVVIRSFLDIAIITYGSNRRAKKEVCVALLLFLRYPCELAFSWSLEGKMTPLRSWLLTCYVVKNVGRA